MFVSMNESMKRLSDEWINERLPSSVTKRSFGKYEERKIHLEKMAYICGGVKKTLGLMLIYRNHVYVCLCPFPFLCELQSLTWISSTYCVPSTKYQVFFYTKMVFLRYPCDLFPFLLLWEWRYFQLEFNNVMFNRASARHAPLCTHQLKGQFDLWWIGI